MKTAWDVNESQSVFVTDMDNSLTGQFTVDYDPDMNYSSDNNEQHEIRLFYRITWKLQPDAILSLSVVAR